MRATVHLSKDEDDFKRITQKIEVQQILTIFETVQAQVSNLKFRDQEVHGLCCHLTNYSLLDNRIASQFSSRGNVFGDSVLCLGGTCPGHRDAARILENGRIKDCV